MIGQTEKITSSLVLLLALLLAAPAYSKIMAQNCSTCQNRRVILYDNEVLVPRPSENRDSILRYWDYFYIAGGLRSYLSSTDPTRDCIRRLDGAFFTTRDTSAMSIKYGVEHANLPPAGPADGFTDYLIHGVVASDNSQQTVTIGLETGKTREVVKAVSAVLTQGFDPFEVGRSLAASMGPLYTTIMNFEIAQRDKGEPFAIKPKLTLTPAKYKLNVGEKTTITVELKDCDGVALKGRKITYQTTGGTCAPASTVTTDGQGKATIEFTAGEKPVIASVTSVFVYTKPTGYETTAQVIPATIQVKKPEDKWFMSATVVIENKHLTNRSGTDSVGFTTESSNSGDWTELYCAAWLKNAAPLTSYTSDIFVADPKDFYYRDLGTCNEYEYHHSHYEHPLGFTDDQRQFSANASTRKSDVEIDISISDESYQLGISNIGADQSGSGMRTQIMGDPITGAHTQRDTLTADTEKLLSFGVEDVSHDTDYTSKEVLTSVKNTTTKTKKVTQTCSWDHKSFHLFYIQDYEEKDEATNPQNGYAVWTQKMVVIFNITYAGEPISVAGLHTPSAPAIFLLNQVYSNTITNAIAFSYILPKATHTTMEIFNARGGKVATLADGLESAGMHSKQWNTTCHPSGIYYLRMSAGENIKTKKIVLSK